MTSYIVMTGARPGGYRSVAVIQLTPEYAAEGRRPTRISVRARGVLRIVHHFGLQRVGKTARSAYHRALSEAEQIAERLNRQASSQPRTRVRARENAKRPGLGKAK